MIKSKTKKVEKYKNHRNKVCRQISYYENKKVIHPDIARCLRDLLKEVATQPQPIKEEEKCEHIFKYDDDLRTSACYRTCIKCGEYELNVNPKAEIRPKQQSKDIEFEEIEEISNTETLDDYQWSERVDIIIDKLIRNQRKIISSLTKRNIK